MRGQQGPGLAAGIGEKGHLAGRRLEDGTDAAADLVTSPDLMSEALRGAPRDWQKKNLQLVLHVKVISGAPSSPKVIQQYFW